MRLLTLTLIALLSLATFASAAPAQGLLLEHVSDNPATVTDANVTVLGVQISESGTRAFFVTSEALLASDTDTTADVYARDADGTLTHVSDGPAAPDQELPASFAGASHEGDRVFFHTDERLIPLSDTDSSPDAYARNADGSLSLLSDDPSTAPDANVSAFFGGASADGSRVLFATRESLVGGDTDTASDVYARNTDGSLSFITSSPSNPDPDLDAAAMGASADGTRVFFSTSESVATFSDTDSQSDIYARNANGTLSHVSDHPTTNPDNEAPAHFGAASDDGGRVFFSTTEQMLTSDNDTTDDVYARNADGTLSHLSDNPATVVDTSASASAFPRGASADGARLLFETTERMLPSDTDGSRDIYAHDDDGTLTHLTDHPTTTADAGIGTSYADSSADASRVFFLTGERLLPSDTDAAMDVYAHNGDGTLSHLSDNPSTAVDSGVDVRAGSVSASADGSRVAFATDEPMLPSDTDNAEDVYVVRPAPPPDGGSGGGGAPSGNGPADGAPDTAGPSGPAVGGGSGAIADDRTVPVIDRLTMARSFRAAASGGPIAAARAKPVGSTVRYGVSEAATATFTVERPAPGRRVGRACRKPSRKTRKRRKCTRYVRVGKPFTHQGGAGANSFKFTGRPGRKLTPGGYRLTLVAADAAGNRSAPKSRPFKIARR